MRIGKLIIISCSLFLFGCSAALVPYTNDPETKIDDAYRLIQDGRALPAEKLAREAVAAFQQKGDYEGMGHAYTVLGVLYSSSAYRAAKKFYQDNGTYDPTYEKSISFHKKAMDSLRKAGDYWGVANSWVGVGDGYTNEGKPQKACDAYSEALKTFEDPNAKNVGYMYSWNQKYPSYKAMLEALVKKSCG
ncbi:hypothetical protein [Mangrovitalea sediminis]|uniref:hypothetical protein n=1 Tax=Mangrovitalea sediminis TaxID=1982043 RepID=UPI000BE5DD3E|nr:hypothetical protein [Mangrovitalea sediminis]